MEMDQENSMRQKVQSDEALQKQVQVRAYLHYLDRGQTDGFHEQDWFLAEEEIIAEKINEETASKKTGTPKLRKAAKQA